MFWTRGYEATSVQDLLDATGLSRASLYGAFGDKEQFFGRVLDHYVSKVEGAAAEVIANKPARVALEDLLEAWLGSTCPKQGPRGCFLLMSGTAGERSALAQQALLVSHARMEKLLEGVIVGGQQRGELGRQSSPRALARFLLVLIQGMATSARAGWSRERIRPAIDEALAHIDQKT